MPKVIASGETITIPAGRVAVLPNVQIDGVLNVEGEVFIPSGATLGDLDAQLALKADTSYVNAQLVLKQNVLVANDAGVKTALNASGTAPIYACRAWVNFNGTGTIAIRASGNVSSITDNGNGDYTINFTTVMPDALYIPFLSHTGRSSDTLKLVVTSATEGGTPTLKTASAIRVNYGNIDLSEVYIGIIR